MPRKKRRPDALPSEVLECMTRQVLDWLRRRRRLRIAHMVDGSTVKDQCARDAFTKRDHRCMFTTINGISEALGLRLEKVIALARRWTRWRKQRADRGQTLSVRVRRAPR